MSDKGLGNAFLDLELDVEVWLASERVPLEKLVQLHPGELLELDHDPDGPVELVVNGTVVAGGELVIVDGRFGFRVTRTAQQRIADLEQTLPAAEPGPATVDGTGAEEETP